MDLHPPRIFQIDGNLGGAAAVIEMLLQSYYEEIDFLPALPAAWPSGSVTGLRARGGYRVDIKWRDGLLTEASVTSFETRVCRVRHRGLDLRVFVNGGRVPVRGKEALIEFDVEKDWTYLIRPWR